MFLRQTFGFGILTGGRADPLWLVLAWEEGMADGFDAAWACAGKGLEPMRPDADDVVVQPCGSAAVVAVSGAEAGKPSEVGRRLAMRAGDAVPAQVVVAGKRLRDAAAAHLAYRVGQAASAVPDRQA